MKVPLLYTFQQPISKKSLQEHIYKHIHAVNLSEEKLFTHTNEQIICPRNMTEILQESIIAGTYLQLLLIHLLRHVFAPDIKGVFFLLYDTARYVAEKPGIE